MGWWGVHPVISKVKAKANLPPGACRICVYMERLNKELFISWNRQSCSRCASIKDVCHAPFNQYQSDLRKILGAIQQGGRYLWSTDLPASLALQGLIRRKIITFKEMHGKLASYVPLVDEFLRFKLR